MSDRVLKDTGNNANFKEILYPCLFLEQKLHMHASGKCFYSKELVWYLSVSVFPGNWTHDLGGTNRHASPVELQEHLRPLKSQQPQQCTCFLWCGCLEICYIVVCRFKDLTQIVLWHYQKAFVMIIVNEQGNSFLGGLKPFQICSNYTLRFTFSRCYFIWCRLPYR